MLAADRTLQQATTERRRFQSAPWRKVNEQELLGYNPPSLVS